MLQTYHLFLFCVVPVSGFGFEKALRVANCLKDCSRFECRETCEQPTSTFDPYPQTNESAMVNITLHCKSVDVIMLSFNSGDYVIEQNTANGTWDTARVSNGNIAKFRDLDPGTSYRYRLHKLLETGFSQPEISDWFTTFEVDYVPQEVKNLSVSKILEDKKNPNQLQAEIVFEPAEDRSCKYNILSWYGEHRLINFEVNEAPIFSFNVPYLEYSQHITVSASASNKDNVSNETTLAFIVPSCLEFWHNLSICVPERVEGLRVEHTHRQGALYDVFVNWNAPEQEPDNYTIQLDLLNSKHSIYRLSVPGNSTQVSFLSLELTTQYAVSIIAESTSGTSLVTTVSKTLIHDRPGYVLFHGIMIGSSAFVTVVILFAVLFYRRYGRKNKHFTMDYAPFKSLNSKDSSLKMAKKPLSQTYAIERSNTPLMLDKFELLPDLLELKGILGNGAYGIVKLGVLKDDCGNAKSVAVKMLKDNPSLEDLKNFQQEILIMKSAGQHPNIVSLIGCCTLNNKPVLVVEYCCKGDLQTYLRTIWESMLNTAVDRRIRLNFEAEPLIDNGAEFISNTSGGLGPHYQNICTIANRLYDIQEDVSKSAEAITGSDLLNFGRQVSTGMEFLSSNRIVHRDLAARNVLVCKDKVVKISDFGLSRDIYQENLYRKQTNGKLPLKWMAIEALTHQVYTIYSDVWSFGILLWEIVTLGAHPYPGIPTDKILKLIKSGYRMEKPSNCGSELYDIMYSCWNARPQSRPTFTELKEKLDKLLSNSSTNEYLSLCDIPQNMTDDNDETPVK